MSARAKGMYVPVVQAWHWRGKARWSPHVSFQRSKPIQDIQQWWLARRRWEAQLKLFSSLSQIRWQHRVGRYQGPHMLTVHDVLPFPIELLLGWAFRSVGTCVQLAEYNRNTYIVISSQWRQRLRTNRHHVHLSCQPRSLKKKDEEMLPYSAVWDLE